MINDTKQNYNSRTNIRDHYTIKFENDKIANHIEPEDFDFNIAKLETNNNMANTVINEVWPLLRILYRARGAFEFTLNFDNEVDSKEFSHQLTSPFNAKFYFKINSQGEWTADFKAKYDQPENYWYYESHNIGTSNAILRIKKFVDIRNKKQPIVPNENLLISDQKTFYEKFKDVDLSFDISYTGTGKW